MDFKQQLNSPVRNHLPQRPQNESGVIFSWKAPEFEVYEKSKTWYLFIMAFLLGLVSYALIVNSPIMAITFILIGVVGYLNLQKEPQIMEFKITTKGIVAGKDLYPFENIKSFWIFYDPPHTKTISLHTNASVFPFIHIPINNEDPVKIRDILIEYIEEIKQEPSTIDVLERVLHI